MEKTLSQRIWTFANPHNFMQLSGRILPYVAVGAATLLTVGLIWGLFFTPPDYQQGHAAKIMFVHVPTAIFAVNIYIVMVVSSAIGLVRRHPVSHLVAKAAAPVGAVFTLIAIITGALWGAPIWNTYWEWDPRLTSVLVLFFFYLGYIAMWSAVEEPAKAAELAAILCLFGSVFAVLSRYAVDIWDASLHQPSSLSLDREENMHDAFSNPLYVMIAAHFLLFLTLLLIGVRTEIRAQRLRSLEMSLT